MAKRRGELREAQDKASLIAKGLWAAMLDLPLHANHGYLSRKGVGAHGVKIDNDNLAVPARDTTASCGPSKKMFVKNGRKSGCFPLWDGPIPVGSDILFAEGYATDAALREATGLPVVVAFDAGNLLPVGLKFAKAFPSNMLAIMANDDRHGKDNTGIARAVETAAVGGAVVALEFAFPASMPTDWNDLPRLEGLEAVRSQVQAGLRAERGLLRKERAYQLWAEVPSTAIALPDCGAGRCSEPQSPWREGSWRSLRAPARLDPRVPPARREPPGRSHSNGRAEAPPRR